MDDDSFVMVDAGAETPSQTFSPMIAVEGSPVPYTPAIESSPTIAHFPSLARSCRPYGHAHKPPACIRAVASTPAIVEQSASVPIVAPSASAVAPATTPSAKRSFAETIKANPAHAVSNNTHVAYAQEASLAVQDQILQRIEQLSAMTDSVPEEKGDEILAALTSYDSPPLKPMTPLTRESTRLYDETTSWTLSVDEPSSKRAKRADPQHLLLTKEEKAAKQAKSLAKGKKSKDKSRLETMAVSRVRDQKVL
jgi:hypothetical protein